MRETHEHEIELGDTEGPVLTALVSAMYGKLKEVPAAIALPLFLAADKYQVQKLSAGVVRVTKFILLCKD